MVVSILVGLFTAIMFIGHGIVLTAITFMILGIQLHVPSLVAIGAVHGALRLASQYIVMRWRKIRQKQHLAKLKEEADEEVKRRFKL